MKNLTTLIFLCLLALAVPNLNATPLPVGGTVVPEALPQPGSATILGDITGTFDFGNGIGHITGSWEEIVAVDPFGLTCAGCLDFVLRVSLDPGLQAGIFGVGMGLFTGFTTNVGYLVGDPNDRTPLSASRGNFRVFFSFVDLSDPANVAHVIGPGQTSAYLVVATDATAFDQNGIVDIFGGRGMSAANGEIAGLFQPVPEPATLALLGLGLAGLGFSRRKRKH